MGKSTGAFYRQILADAWRTVRRHRTLWLLGFFVSFLGNGGVYELVVQGTGRLGLQEGFGKYFTFGLLPGERTLAAALGDLGTGNQLLLLLVILAVLALLAIAAWVILSAQGGLISAIRAADKGRAPTFNVSFSAGNEVFGPLLALNLLSRLMAAAIFYLLLALTVLYLADANVWSALAYLAGFVLLLPLTLIIGFVTLFAACYVTLQRLPFVAAVESAVALFRKHWLISLETAGMLFGVNLLAAAGIGLVIGAAGIALIPFVLGASLLGSGAALGIVGLAATIVAVLFLATVGSGLAAFQYAVWVHLFTKLHQRGHGARPKLARWFDRLLK